MRMSRTEHIEPQTQRRVYRLTRGARLADEAEPFAVIDQHPQHSAHHLVVVADEDTDAHHRHDEQEHHGYSD